ncbi:hypothetical protein P8S54_00480 [Thiomicrospira sp. R3]|uniref:hypothetical protein n=1 Tax=Thiomicrospira sp. R3 TaxID=3035472 RepID=UPI00259B4629|nr:hypothetical protein [Thiomicrospira sp. R3]WFE68808.1 hypothetical protein P8S54_00480 [Thiomicrospira sp. R3]
MNIINIGGWYVGNTAILDWMDGFEELAFVKGDFNVTRLEGGIMDMMAEKDINRKLQLINNQKKESIKGLARAFKSLVGRYTKHIMKPRMSPSYNGHFRFHSDYLKYLSRYENMLKAGEKFDEINFWQNWLSTLPKLDSGHKNYKHIVYQNPFFYDETYAGHKDIWPQIFSPYKMIFVHRDPLDQFSDIVNSGGHLNVSWPRFHGGTENMHPADRYFSIAKKLYTARLRMAENLTKDDLVIFSFEDFLQNHERVTTELKSFLDISSERNQNNKRFVREKSLKNIGKGQHNQEALKLLENKKYVLDELNELRNKLSEHRCAI